MALFLSNWYCSGAVAESRNKNEVRRLIQELAGKDAINDSSFDRIYGKTVSVIMEYGAERDSILSDLFIQSRDDNFRTTVVVLLFRLAKNSDVPKGVVLKALDSPREEWFGDSWIFMAMNELQDRGEYAALRSVCMRVLLLEKDSFLLTPSAIGRLEKLVTVGDLGDIDFILKRRGELAGSREQSLTRQLVRVREIALSRIENRSSEMRASSDAPTRKADGVGPVSSSVVIDVAGSDSDIHWRLWLGFAVVLIGGFVIFLWRINRG